MLRLAGDVQADEAEDNKESQKFKEICRWTRLERVQTSG